MVGTRWSILHNHLTCTIRDSILLPSAVKKLALQPPCGVAVRDGFLLNCHQFCCLKAVFGTAVFGLSTRWCSVHIRSCFLMASAAPLSPLRAPVDTPDVWRVSIRFLGDSEVPPAVISHGTVATSPASSLHDLVQGIEHEGCLTSAVHGIQIMAYTSAPISSCMTARPTVGDTPRLGSAGSVMSDRRNLGYDGHGPPNLVGQHAATLTDPMLTVNEHQFLADFALHVHQRLMRSRGTGPPSSEYAAAAWLTTRAYIARSLDDLRQPVVVSTPRRPRGPPPDGPVRSDEADLA